MVHKNTWKNIRKKIEKIQEHYDTSIVLDKTMII